MAISDHLKGCPLFFELYDHEIEKIVRHCDVFSFEKNAQIIKKGEESTVIYVMLEGRAMIQRRDGKKRIDISPLTQGDVFGEMILLDQKIRSADVTSLTKCHVLEIHYDKIFQLFQKEPRIFGLLMLNLCRLLSKRVRTANDIIQSLTQNRGKLQKAA